MFSLHMSVVVGRAGQSSDRGDGASIQVVIRARLSTLAELHAQCPQTQRDSFEPNMVPTAVLNFHLP